MQNPGGTLTRIPAARAAFHAGVLSVAPSHLPPYALRSRTPLSTIPLIAAPAPAPLIEENCAAPPCGAVPGGVQFHCPWMPSASAPAPPAVQGAVCAQLEQ